jgi:hypothetical protein
MRNYHNRTTYQVLLHSLGLTILLVIGGCSSVGPWVKPGAEPGQVDQQLAVCTLVAESVRYDSDEPSEARKSRIAHFVSLCMRANGWHQQDPES